MKKIKMFFMGFYKSAMSAITLFISISFLVFCNDAVGWNAIIKFLIGIAYLVWFILSCYEVGKWRQEFMKSEKEKKENLHKILHNSLCETETYKVDKK